MLSPEQQTPGQKPIDVIKYPSPEELLQIKKEGVDASGIENKKDDKEDEDRIVREANEKLARVIADIAKLPQEKLEAELSTFIDYLLRVVETDPATSKAIPSYDFWTKTISGAGNEFEEIVRSLQSESTERLHQKIATIQKNLLLDYDKETGVTRSFLIRKVKALTPIGLKLFYELDRRKKLEEEKQRALEQAKNSVIH